jgi:hypothetical protein
MGRISYRKGRKMVELVLRIQNQVSGALLTPGSGMGKKIRIQIQDSDPG